MKKVMFVTVGTSLFHSASWEPSREVEMDVSCYSQWTKGDYLGKPEARKKSPDGATIQQSLEKVLNTGNAEKWARRLAGELLHDKPDLIPMQFSAELATLLKLYQTEVPPQTLTDFLKSYSSIYVVHDDSGSEKARLPTVAAFHLVSALNLLSGGNTTARRLGIVGLSSTSKDELFDGLKRLVRSILANLDEAQQIDLLVSGGYKLYGVVLATLVRSLECAARLLYIHEEGGILLQVPREMKNANGSALSAERKAALEAEALDVGSFY